MDSIIDTILTHDIARTVIDYFNSMSKPEITIVIIVLGLLILFIAGRWFGSGAVIALSIIYVMIYALYVADIFTLEKNYEQQQIDRDRYIQNEIDKNFSK